MAKFLHYLDINERNQAVSAITKAIAATLLADKATSTKAEIKHRFGIGLGLVEAMRNDLGWSWSRISDTLPSALSSWLINGDWSPTEKNAWVVQPNTGLIHPGILK